MTSEKFIAELEQLNLKHIRTIKQFINNLQQYFPNKTIIVNSPNALMKYLKKALDQLVVYIDQNEKVAEGDPDLKFKREKAMISYRQLQAVLKELRGRHDPDGFWNWLWGKGGKFK
jgi:hypothetical protein